MTSIRHEVAAFYRFVSLDRLDERRLELLEEARELELIGTILIAEEGINGTLAAKTRFALETFFSRIGADPRLSALPIKWSTATKAPFDRLLIKRKREIVPLGVEGIDPRRRVGQYVAPANWNALLADPELVLIDARNNYEVGMGHFEGAIDPHTNDFRDLPSWFDQNLDPTRDKKVAMYCTGGIRCEKASAYLLERGFELVYHLEGGILAYLEQVPKDQSRFQGACFVFDQRVSLEHGLETGAHTLCPRCGDPQLADSVCLRCRSSTGSDVLHQDHAE